MPGRVPILATALLALASTSLGGCATSTKLTAKRLHDGDAPEGVPLTLTKPVFVITETRATLEKPNTSYTLAVDYVPDADQRFTVALSPATLAEADLKLLLGDLGQLTELNSATRDQVVPTLKAVGSFLTKAVGAVATAAGTAAILDKGPKQPEFFAKLDSYTSTGCPVPPSCSGIASQSPERCAALQAAWKRFKERWNRLQQVELLFPVDDDEEFLLDVARKGIACDEDNFRQALDALLKKHEHDPIIDATVFIDRIAGSTSAADVNKAIQDLQGSTLADPVKAEIAALGPLAKAILANAEETKELALLARSWRHAYASYLEREIDRRQRQEAVVETSPAKTAEEVKARQDEIDRLRSEVGALRLRWARVIDAAEEYGRAEKLRGVLLAMANRQQQSTPPARGSFSEYEVARKELVTLEVAIGAKRAAIVPAVADKKTPTPPPTREIHPAVLWKPAGVSSAKWVLGCLGANPDADCAEVPWTERPAPGTLPEFVVVVEKGAQP